MSNKVVDSLIGWLRRTPRSVLRLSGVVLVLILSVILLMYYSVNDTGELTGRRTQKYLSTRLDRLNSCMEEALGTPPSQWPSPAGLSRDMVIYKYVQDTLQSWCNSFILDNDDITTKVLEQRFLYLRNNLYSPLRDVTSTLQYMNLGPKWYLIKSVEDPSTESLVIGALEIKRNVDGNYNGVNPALHVPERFHIYPISYSGGTPVRAEGIPLFKIIREHDAPLAFRTELFSPMIYSGGSILYSLGSVLITGFIVFLVVLLLYMNRIRIYKWTRKGDLRMGAWLAFLLVSALSLIVYSNFIFRSVIQNSNITLELYKIAQIGRYTFPVYLLLLLQLLSVWFILEMARGPLGYFFGLKYKPFSRVGRTLFAVLCSIYLVSMASVLGFRREASRVEIWANRLAIDRDLGFELQLRNIEKSIAVDPVINALVSGDRDYRVVMNRLVENYFGRISQSWDLDVYISRENDNDQNAMRYFNERLRNSVAIADSSHFMYSRSPSGRAQYTGIFLYYAPSSGVSRLLLSLGDNADRQDKGYSAIIGSTSSGSVIIPARYSYAKYLEGKLVNYRGAFPYPTRLEEDYDQSHNVTARDGYVHFTTNINPEETIIVSRQRTTVTQYAMSLFLLALMALLLVNIPHWARHREKPAERGYFKSRINLVLYISLITTLVVMAVVSVLFVYRRNESNQRNLMTGKIGTIQTLLENGCRYFTSYQDFATKPMNHSLDDIGGFTNSDITLYTPSGKVFLSTYPEVFEKMILGPRIEAGPYNAILKGSRRFFVNRETISGQGYSAMYAPLFNENGALLAIVSSPYTESTTDFKSEAIFHSIFILTVFLILMILSRIITTEVVEKMFHPLFVMSSKMKQARTEGLEYIIYDRDDEISPLVRAYNLMVHDLSESSKQAAQLERDKAWSEMARQVAHEIKNPLTPIRLQIQRIARLKSKGDPLWEEKFDAVVPVILDSIDTLTDTANEFSTFAKLYGEEPVRINLDTLCKDQVALFDERENISFQYIGFQDAYVMGPKPQLTRVLVNLITNAVQAIENMQAEQGAPKVGQVWVSLRNSTKDGFYDIVFEDNGPGVKDENRSKLFTPNFTTKSAGTGLGLAICKNILERCGGDIFYSRSFNLGGACFTVRMPKADA